LTSTINKGQKDLEEGSRHIITELFRNFLRMPEENQEEIKVSGVLAGIRTSVSEM
jgi:hypothetical protein